MPRHEARSRRPTRPRTASGGGVDRVERVRLERPLRSGRRRSGRRAAARGRRPRRARARRSAAASGWPPRPRASERDVRAPLATPASTPAIQPSPKATTAMAPAAIDGRTGPERQRQRQQDERLRRQERDREERLRAARSPDDERDDGDREQRRRRPRRRRPRPPARATGRASSSARRNGRARIARATPDSMSPPIAGAPRNAAVIARTKLNMNAMRIRTWRDADPDLELLDAVVAGQRHEPFEPQPTSSTETIDRPARTQQDPPADELADVEPSDDDHGVDARRGRGRTSSRKRSSSEPPTRLDGVDAAAGRHDRGDEVGDPLGGERPERRAIAVVRSGPNAPSAGSAAASSPVTRIRTPSPATTSSSGRRRRPGRGGGSRPGRRRARPR